MNQPSVDRLAGSRDISLAVLVAVLSAAAARGDNYRARYARIEEPQWLKLRITDVEAGIYAEKSVTKVTYRDPDRFTRYERSFLAPSLGLSLAGSVYHPNFLQFSLAGDGGYGWEKQKTTSTSAAPLSQNGLQYYGDFHGSADFLANKPYNARLYANYGRSYREYDFFTRSTVDTRDYGTRLTYRRPSLFLYAGYSRTEEDVLDSSAPSGSRQDALNFDAQKERRSGGSSFNYTFSRYRFTSPDPTGETTYHTFAFADTERLGRQERANLQSNLGYNRLESGTEPSDQITGSLSLLAEHRANLSSSCNLSYDRFSSGPFASDSYTGSASLRHQLYESLASTLSAQATDAESSDEVNSGYSRSFGVGLTENYTKRLGAEHRLRIDNSLFVNHVERETIGEARNEPHVFPAPPAAESFFLNLPNVDEATLVVTDARHLRTYLRTLDYEVFRSGSRTEIRRIVGGSIPEGSTVVAEYQASPTPRGTYRQVNERFGVRLELWRDRWALYGRLHRLANNASSDLHVEDVTSYTFGTDLSWRWFRAGAEYEIYESTDSSYRSTRLFQSAAFSLDRLSALSLNSGQSFRENRHSGLREEDYRFTARYHRALTRNLRGDLDAGVDVRRGDSVDQTLAVFRPELDYTIGRTRIQSGYDYEYNLYRDRERRDKHQFTLRMRRSF